MKVLLMPVRPQARTLLSPAIQRHLEAVRFAASVTVALVFGLAATLILALGIALALAVILSVITASAASLIFMVVNPEGNLLLLLLLSQLWLIYAPRKTSPDRQPDGGLTIKPEHHDALRQPRSLAA